ncbi:MAG: sulfotransferase [Verrucomicrobia bacterium]|nr:sulfotransferase [Verrucomicrobiota bacterium]
MKANDNKNDVNKRRIKRPIIIIGAPRSGTTLLGQLFAAHPDVAYWEEPRTVWSTENQHLPNDLLREEHLTPQIATKIDQRFSAFLQQNDKTRFAEKTPSNMLRIPFIHALYPDCKIIHLHRDPRPVIASALRMLNSPPDLKRITARAREAKLRDWPSLSALLFRDTLARLFRKGTKPFWGPRPPVWQDWLNLPPVTMLSKQWCALMQTAQHDLQQLPPNSWMEIRYEDLLNNHARILPELLEFAELSPSNEVTNLANQSIQADRTGDWRQSLPQELLREIETETATLLSKLGYEL